MKVVLLGKDKLLAHMIESAIAANVEIVGVMRYERTTHSKLKLFFHDFFKTSHDLTLIKQYKLPEIKCKSVNSREFRDFILKNQVDIVLVGTWQEKIKKETFVIPKIGTINIHPSLLPKYRGPNPYAQVILNNEERTGVSLHLVDENFDTGAVLLQEEVEILPNDTSKELRERCLITAKKLVFELLCKLQTEIIIPIPQNNENASYFGHLDPDLKTLNFRKKTAEEISTIVRAYNPWLPCYIEFEDDFYIVNPYNITILNEHNYNKIAGILVDKDAKNRSLTFICKDGKAIKASKLKLYNIFKRPFTKYFIEKINL